MPAASVLSASHVALLIEAAKDTLPCTYGGRPGGRRFAAAVLATDGSVYAGAAYKSETRTLSLHAEQVALCHAAAHGHTEVLAVVILSDSDPNGHAFTNPCGMCKQLLYENSRRSGREMLVVLANLRGDYEVIPLANLIVYPWP